LAQLQHSQRRTKRPRSHTNNTSQPAPLGRRVARRQPGPAHVGTTAARA